jgi:hypothetical protein
VSEGAAPVRLGARLWASRHGLALWWALRVSAAALPGVVAGRLAGSTLGHHELGERALLDGGGELLVELWARGGPGLEALGLVAVGASLLATPLLLAAAGAVVAQAASPGRGLREALGVAGARLGSLLLAWSAWQLARALALLVGFSASGGAAKALVTDDARGAVVAASLTALALAPAWFLGWLHELVRVELVVGASWSSALEGALSLLRRERLRLLGAAALASLAGALAVAGGLAGAWLLWHGPLVAFAGAFVAAVSSVGALVARAGFVAHALELRSRGARGAAVEPSVATRLQDEASLE